MAMVSELMSPGPVCADEHEDLVAVAARMRDMDVGSLIICDADGRPIGVVTDRDVVLRCVAENGNPARMRAPDVSSVDPACVAVDAPVEEATGTMAGHQLRRLPVVDADGKLVGVVAQADIARAESEEYTGDVVEEISR